MEIVFVYNAKSGLLNGTIDFIHKIVSPETYECSLCGMTYGNLGMRKEWARFIDQLPFPVRFTYPDKMDEAQSKQTAGINMPVALLKTSDGTDVLVLAEEINGCSTLDELIELVSERVSQAIQSAQMDPA